MMATSSGCGLCPWSCSGKVGAYGSIHHVQSNVQLIESTGAKVLFLPPYSPDLNPLEPVFGKVKTILKENDPIFQTTSTPRLLLALAFTMVTPEDCFNFSKHCGYI